jgi:hypothetical protein
MAVKNEIKKEIERYYSDWKNKSRSQKERLKNLKEIFPNTEFTDNRPPHFFGGKLDAPIVIIGLNPGYSEENKENDWELKQKRDSFEDYWNFSQNFFQRCTKKGEEGKSMPYYEDFSRFIRGLRGDEYKESTTSPEYLEYLSDVGVLSLELIPYHSSSIDSIDTNDSKIKQTLNEYAEIVNKIVQLHDREHVIIHGTNNLKYWTEGEKIELTRAGSGPRKKVNYARTDKIFDNTVLVKQFLPYFGWETLDYYLLGQALR